MPERTVDALILAAGASRRLGQPKQSVHVCGQSLLQRAVTLAQTCVDGSVHVVVGAHAQRDRAMLDPTIALVHEFEGWREGQGASLAFGLGQAKAGDGVLVLLCDQYRLTPDDLCALLAAWRVRPECCAAATYAGTIGVPVVWPREAIAALMRDGRPGRERLDPANCTTVEMPRAAFDLDTPEDLASLRAYERGLLG